MGLQKKAEKGESDRTLSQRSLNLLKSSKLNYIKSAFGIFEIGYTLFYKNHTRLSLVFLRRFEP